MYIGETLYFSPDRLFFIDFTSLFRRMGVGLQVPVTVKLWGLHFLFPNSRRWTTKRLACWIRTYMRNTVLHLQPSASAEHVKVLPTESCEWYCTRICRFVALKDTLRIASSHLGISFSRWWSTETLPVILGQNTFSSIIMVENGCVTIRHWRCFPMGAMEGFGSFWMIFQSSYCFR